MSVGEARVGCVEMESLAYAFIPRKKQCGGSSLCARMGGGVGMCEGERVWVKGELEIRGGERSRGRGLALE